MENEKWTPTKGRKKVYPSAKARRMAHYYRERGDEVRANFYETNTSSSLRERKRTAIATLKSIAERQSVPYEFVLEEAVLAFLESERSQRL